jgi:hypothetical protein
MKLNELGKVFVTTGNMSLKDILDELNSQNFKPLFFRDVELVPIQPKAEMLLGMHPRWGQQTYPEGWKRQTLHSSDMRSNNFLETEIIPGGTLIPVEPI